MTYTGHGKGHHSQDGISPADRVEPNMPVVSADGEIIGVVEGIEGETIRLVRDGHGEHRLLPLSLVAGVADGKVTMRERGDNAFGMEA